jgi:hypothetical protein
LSNIEEISFILLLYGLIAALFRSGHLQPFKQEIKTLVTKGDGMTRTCYWRTRMHLAKEAVDEQRIIIRHCKTKLMTVDGFTKPLEGFNFQQFMQYIMPPINLTQDNWWALYDEQ